MKHAWTCSLDQHGHARANGEVCEITEHLDLSSWPPGTRVIVRRERAHPGAQLSFTDHDGHRFQAILTDQSGPIAELERDHRGRARVEDHIGNDKTTGLRNLPFRDFAHNHVWLAIVGLAHDLMAWTHRLLLTGELASAEAKRLRYRRLHIAARLAFHARTATLRPPACWPWAQATRRRIQTYGRASPASLNCTATRDDKPHRLALAPSDACPKIPPPPHNRPRGPNDARSRRGPSG